MASDASLGLITSGNHPLEGTLMPPNVSLNTFLSEDRQRATLEIHADGTPLAHAIFDPPEFEQLIETLAALRAGMVDEVPREIDPGSRLAAIVDPVWRELPDHDDGKVLSLRHPGFGWLTFLIPWHEATHIAQQLGRPNSSPKEVDDRDKP
jgi:hypothetical protein